MEKLIDRHLVDCDNFLYDAMAYAYPQMYLRMDHFMQRALGASPAEAAALRTGYYRQYGATLTGLMKNHSVDPEEFLDYAHGFDVAPIRMDPKTRDFILQVREPMTIVTSSSRNYIDRLLEHFGMARAFTGAVTIEDMDYGSKAEKPAWDKIEALLGFNPVRTSFGDDLHPNLFHPHAMGLTTGWLHGPEAPAEKPPHVHHMFGRLQDSPILASAEAAPRLQRRAARGFTR